MSAASGCDFVSSRKKYDHPLYVFELHRLLE